MVSIHLKAKDKTEWIEATRQSTRYNMFKTIEPEYPISMVMKEMGEDTKERQARINQLRTGHVPLQAYLHRFKIEDSATCPTCGARKEDVPHYLWQCPTWWRERRAMKRELERGEELGVWMLGSRRKWQLVATYVEDTGRFKPKDTR